MEVAVLVVMVMVMTVAVAVMGAALSGSAEWSSGPASSSVICTLPLHTSWPQLPPGMTSEHGPFPFSYHPAAQPA